MQYPVSSNGSFSCAECGLLPECGGLEGEGFKKGCFERCELHCRAHGCDVVCPSCPLVFADMFEDVGGICVPPNAPLLKLVSDALPVYMPQINHGSSRAAVLSESWVSVPLYEIARRNSKGRYDVRFSNPESLRAALRLSQATKIVLTSVAHDYHIEDFWEEHQVKNILPKLARLGFAAMTVPNYSFILDVPRSNTLYNFSRMFRVAERITEAGLPTILHLNASTKRDWQRWRDILREQSHVEYVALEFQTGPSTKDIGDRYFAGLVELQESLGRKIHPLVLAGAGRMKQLHEFFGGSFTVVDATPFIKTMKRQVLLRNGARWKWRTAKTVPGESLHARLALNIRSHRSRLLERVGLDGGREQLLLGRAA